MNILVTGARAPISVDIARTLITSGHQVWLADTMRFPIGRFCPGIAGYKRIPSPKFNFSNFSAEIVKICTQQKIDYIVPTCEEVFWLANVQGLPAHTQLRTTSFNSLARLHNKHEFALLADQFGFGADENQYIASADALDAALAKIADATDYVAKPVFSRFASQTLISPTKETLGRINPTVSAPWLIQKRALGTEYCVYCLAENGELLTYVAYLPKYRLSKHGASVYFEPVTEPGLEEMAKAFIKATHFSGQISFDVIATKNRYIAIECNPRGTSGAHLLAQTPALYGDALLGHAPDAQVVHREPAMLALPLLLSHPGLVLSAHSRSALSCAYDAMYKAGVPLRLQMLGLIEMLGVSILDSVGVLQATTADIEWNGEEILGAA